MARLNRLTFWLFMVLFILAGLTLFTRAAATATPATVPQADSPVIVNSFPLPGKDLVSNEEPIIHSDVITGTQSIYFPMVRRSGPEVCGEIIADTVWKAAVSPYQVTCDVVVAAGVTLRVEPGVSMQFYHPEDDLIISGTLQAVGTVSAPLHFLSVNGAIRGNWGKVAFMPGSSGVLDHAILEYGGVDDGMVFIASDAVQVLNSIVRYSTDIGIYIQAASPLITGTQIYGNWGGGLFNGSGSPTIQNNSFTDNSNCCGSGNGGGLSNDSGSPIIQNNTFTNNDASYGGGLYNGSGSPIIQNNKISLNWALDGGGIYDNSGSSLIQNNIISGNTAYGDCDCSISGSGGGINTSSKYSIIQYNTIYGNLSVGRYDVGGGGIYNSGNPIIRGNIVVNNTAQAGGGIYNLGSPTFDYNDVWGNAGGDYYGTSAGAHDISTDPLLVDPANGNFHLASGSTCIDAGDPANDPPTDFEGDPRPMGLASDIGADEFPTFRVKITGTPGVALPHSPVTYTVIVANPITISLTSVALTVTLPVEAAFSGYHADGLTCTHDGSAWGGQLRCTLDEQSLAPGQQRMMIMTVLLTGAIDSPKDVINAAMASASGDGKTFIARDQTRTRVSWCQVRLNDTPVSDIQAAMDASTLETDVIQVSGYCAVHDLTLSKTLTLQGGWGLDFGEWNPALHTTTLDAQILGRVILVDGDVSPTIDGFVITGGTTNENGGGISISSGSPTIQNNTFTGNHAGADGGGLYTGSGNPLIQNNTFSSNNANGGGGAFNQYGSPIIQNNTFTGNLAYDGGGLDNGSGSPLIQNNTFYNNLVSYRGGGLFSAFGNPVIRNNIAVNNSASHGGGIYTAAGAPFLDYNDVWNNSEVYNEYTPGPHDISTDPLLIDPVNGDFHLAPGSPCIDAGDPDNYPPTDFDGDPRPMGQGPDMGVDEFRTLGVTITGTPGEAPPGSPITYTVIVANLTNLTLINVVLTDSLPIEAAFTGYQADGLTCTHDGSAWGGQLHCTLDSLSLAPNERREMTVTVLLTETFTAPQDVINIVRASASGDGKTFIGRDQTRTWVTLCRVQLNDKPMGWDLQAAIDASMLLTDVVKVTDYCHVHDLIVNKTLTLQGGWSHDFSEWDPSVYTTTLDGQGLGRVILVEGDITPMIEGFYIIGGNVGGPGGGIYITIGSPTIQHNTFARNFALNGGGLYNDSGSPIIRNNAFTGNTAEYGGGMYNASGSPTLLDNFFTSNIALTDGGGFYNTGNPTIQGNTFSGNSASNGDGGGLYNGLGSPMIQNNTFAGNFAQTDGGGIINNGNPTIQNNIFIGNRVGNKGGGISNYGSPTIQNNLITGSTAFKGGGLYTETGSPIVRSNIFMYNCAWDGAGGISNSFGTPTLDYNDMWVNGDCLGGGDWNYEGVDPGPHDISADPLLVDPANGDYHLASGSPCIDAGDPVNYPPTDFEGDLRPMGLAPDIGPDEYRSP